MCLWSLRLWDGQQWLRLQGQIVLKIELKWNGQARKIVEGEMVSLPKEIIQVFGLTEQSDEVNEEGIWTQGEEDIVRVGLGELKNNGGGNG